MKTSWLLPLAMAIGFAAPARGQEPDADAFTRWASAHAVALPACTAQSDADAMRVFAPTVGDASVLALGEPAHGAHEPLALRNCLFRFLVEHQGFTAIAIESGLSESRQVQDYVAGGTGDVRSIVRDSLSWGFGRFGENVELIEWMHRYNLDLAHTHKIRFYGIDMSGGERSGQWRNARITLDAALAYVARAAPRRSHPMREAVAPFLDRFTLPSYWAMTVADRQRLRSAISHMVRFFDRQHQALVAATNESDFAWARRNAVLARQLEATFAVSRADDDGGDLRPDDFMAVASRDRAMADNVLWALAREGKAGRILLFAHDGHVANATGRGGIWSVFREAPPAMGQHLRAALGGQYRIIVTGSATIAPRLGSGQPGTLDRALTASGRVPLLIDLRSADPAAVEWLARDRTLRTNFTTESILAPRTAMDAVAFLAELTPASRE